MSNVIRFPIGTLVAVQSVWIITEPADRKQLIGEIIDETTDFPAKGYGRDGKETWRSVGELVRFSSGKEMWIPAVDLMVVP